MGRGQDHSLLHLALTLVGLMHPTKPNPLLKTSIDPFQV